MVIKFPYNKKFAFTVFDDTDKATIENIKPIYDLLGELKIYITKSVWSFINRNPILNADKGLSLEDKKYLKFILNLRDQGFEIAFHGAKEESSKREETIKAIEFFKEKIGYYPKTYANHASNRENIYWGINRIKSSLLKILYKLATLKKKRIFEGDLPNSEYFWGDICQKYIIYTRNFVFPGINTLSYNPSMPYYDPKKPFVNFWFSASDGHDVETFNRLIDKKNIDKLEKENGVCIVYTHFANGFVKNGQVNKKTRELLTYLSQKNGWFVPVSTLLDFLREQKANREISKKELTKMEHQWFFSKIIYGTT